jgi:hypothetical protein
MRRIRDAPSPKVSEPHGIDCPSNGAVASGSLAPTRRVSGKCHTDAHTHVQVITALD